MESSIKHSNKEMNISVNGLSKLTDKSIKNGIDSGYIDTESMFNVDEYRKWFSSDGDKKMFEKSTTIHSDNRKICKKLFGKQSYCFDGEGRYYCYFFEYRKEINNKEAIAHFVYMANGVKGSSIEMVLDYNGIKTDKRLVVPFMKMLINLFENGETILKRNENIDIILE